MSHTHLQGIIGRVEAVLKAIDEGEHDDYPDHQRAELVVVREDVAEILVTLEDMAEEAADLEEDEETP